MPKCDIAAALTVAAVEAEVEAIRLGKKQAETERARREAEATARRARQLGHST